MGRPFDIPKEIPLAEQDGRTYRTVVELMRRLLAEDGCPWDREQTISSLKKYVLEEACEVMDSIEANDRSSLRDELGDLAFQVVFLSELAQREGAFGPDDVFRGVIEKLVRRHPHVFGDGQASTPQVSTSQISTPGEVETQWEAIKAEEKRDRPLLDNIPRSLPALEGARRMSERVATVGFDWKDSVGSRAKVEEELSELDEAAQGGDLAAVEHELGDILFALVNYGRHLGVDPEHALRKTNDRFRKRFGHVEERVRSVHSDWPRKGGKATSGVPMDELESYWRQAKELESHG